MILLLVVSLYTSRVVLSALGFNDYGIYNVVGGIVSMFVFINTAMGNATSRFITFALGKGDKENVTTVFNAAILVHMLIALLIILLSETVGLWFLYNKMVIPVERMNAAFWVYQFSVISCVATIVHVPFNATIIAKERMGAFAYLSLLDASLKLGIAFLITWIQFDRLIFYAILILIVHLLDVGIYFIYCSRSFEEVRLKKVKDFSIIKEMTGFAGWSLIGNLAFICMTQGQNILLNIFFGPVVNAARGIAVNVQSAIKGFVTNFQMAVNPQITKSYAIEDFDRLHMLIISGSKFSFFLMFCIGLPIALNCNVILHIWLDRVPEYSEQFTILTLAIILFDTLSNPIGIANNATGNIKKYQIFEGGTLLLIVPIAFVVLECGGKPISTFWIQLIFVFLAQVIRVIIVCPKIKMSIRYYVYKLVCPIVIVTVVASLLAIFLRKIIKSENIYIDCFTGIMTTLSTSLFVILTLGLSRFEIQIIKRQLGKIANMISIK